jgi:hypothetical protein
MILIGGLVLLALLPAALRGAWRMVTGHARRRRSSVVMAVAAVIT